MFVETSQSPQKNQTQYQHDMPPCTFRLPKWPVSEVTGELQNLFFKFVRNIAHILFKKFWLLVLNLLHCVTYRDMMSGRVLA